VLRAGLVGAAAAGVLVTSGCRLRVGSPPKPRAVVPPEPTPDEQALDRAADLADGLAALYAQGALTRPDLAPALRQLAADHTAHRQALQALRPRSTSSASSAGSGGSSPTSTPTSSPTSSSTAPALTPATLVSALGQAERAAIATVLGDLATTGPQAARLLASIAACGSSHVTLLARLPAPRKATQ
jgi:hypothetical protein